MPADRNMTEPEFGILIALATALDTIHAALTGHNPAPDVSMLEQAAAIRRTAAKLGDTEETINAYRLALSHIGDEASRAATDVIANGASHPDGAVGYVATHYHPYSPVPLPDRTKKGGV